MPSFVRWSTDLSMVSFSRSAYVPAKATSSPAFSNRPSSMPTITGRSNTGLLGAIFTTGRVMGASSWQGRSGAKANRILWPYFGRNPPPYPGLCSSAHDPGQHRPEVRMGEGLDHGGHRAAGHAVRAARDENDPVGRQIPGDRLVERGA